MINVFMHPMNDFHDDLIVIIHEKGLYSSTNTNNTRIQLSHTQSIHHLCVTCSKNLYSFFYCTNYNYLYAFQHQDGCTPLHIAARKNDVQMARILIDAKAHLDSPNEVMINILWPIGPSL